MMPVSMRKPAPTPEDITLARVVPTAVLNAKERSKRARQLVGQSLRPLKPAVRGTLEQSSLTSVLVQCLGTKFDGSVLLLSPDGGMHVVSLHQGTPVKVMTTAHVAALDAVLLEMGALDAETLAWSLAKTFEEGGLHGQALLRHQRLVQPMLLEALAWQLRRKLFHFHQLPIETRCACYPGVDALADYGGPERTPYDVAALVLDGLRARPDDPAIDETLKKIGSASISLRAEAEPRRLALEPTEQVVIDLLQRRAHTVAQLVRIGVAPEHAVLNVVHALASLGWIDWRLMRT
jgi:hypothetical protein